MPFFLLFALVSSLHAQILLKQYFEVDFLLDESLRTINLDSIPGDEFNASGVKFVAFGGSADFYSLLPNLLKELKPKSYYCVVYGEDLRDLRVMKRNIFAQYTLDTNKVDRSQELAKFINGCQKILWDMDGTMEVEPFNSAREKKWGIVN